MSLNDKINARATLIRGLYVRFRNGGNGRAKSAWMAVASHTKLYRVAVRRARAVERTRR